MRKFFSIIFAAAVVAAASSCVKDGFEEGGGTIRFGVSTVYENGPATKTEYSGKDQNNNNISSTSTAERINWLSTDKIRILCSQASVPNSTNKYADYQIVLQGSSTNLNHDAKIEPADGNGLQWGTGKHYFFALYPAQTQNPYATITPDTETKAKVNGKILHEQNVTLDGHVFKPDMNYAYMYAFVGLSPEADAQLNFKPLVTALEFTLLTRTGDAITSKLTSVKLSSTQTGSYLAGDFTATIANNALSPTIAKSNITNGSNEITIYLPDGGVQLSTTDAYTVTFLTLPMNQTNLTLTLFFEDGTKRTLELKDDNQWITAAACKKTYIWKLDAPKNIETYTYTFDVTAPVIDASDPQGQFSITSYRKGDRTGKISPVEWEIVGYSDNIGQTYSMSGRPAWITSIVSAGTPSGADATTYDITVTANETPIRWDGETKEEEDLRDLSCYDIYGKIYPGATNGVPYNTANCYVVSAPGYYMFPIVYGNAIQNGADSTAAYRKGQADAANMMGAFKNHLGNAITSPWIQDNVSLPAGQSYDANGKGQLFEVLWESVDGLINRLPNRQQISWGEFGGKLYAAFAIKADKITQGNAVIAVKDVNGKIAWCWHIWVMDNPEKKLASKTVYSHPEVNISTVNPQEMLAMNLGFCEGSVPQRNVIVRFAQAESGMTVDVPVVQEGSNDSYSPAYQWGRKDPIYPYVNGTMKTVYDGNGSTITSLSTSAASTVQNSIQNPTTYYLPNGKGNWCTTRYDNLWNSRFTTVGEDEYVRKTIYDPCPPGFKVPNKNAFSGFVKNGIESQWQNPTTLHLMFKNSSSTAFYLNPENYSNGGISFYHNYVLSTSGSSVTPHSGVYLQTATPSIDGSQEKNMFFVYYPNSLQAYSYVGESRYYALSVRPVKE